MLDNKVDELVAAIHRGDSKLRAKRLRELQDEIDLLMILATEAVQEKENL